MFWMIIVCALLSGCGQYGALYLPSAAKTKAVNSKAPDNAPDIAVQVNREKTP